MAAEAQEDYVSLDDDSAFGASISDQSDSTSVASSILKYRQENGRTYANYGIKEYWAPNDEEEQDSLDIAHHYNTLLAGGKLLRTPVKPGINRVLDLGTGTGIWAIDFADAYPEADVKGIDISPIQPSFLPPNCRFEVDDYNRDLYDENKYDLIHIRDLHGSIADPPKFYAQCYQALAPGGWLDITEIDPVDSYSASHSDQPMSELLPKDDPLVNIATMFIEACEKMGIDGRSAPKIEGCLRDAGFQNISAEKVKAPVGRWPKDKRQKEIGAWNLLRLETSVVGMYMRLGTSLMGLTPEEVQALCARLKSVLRNQKWQMYLNVYFLSAQKPEA